MKAVRKLAILFSLSALLPFASSAKSIEQAYLNACRKSSDVPVPVAVVSPHVSAEAIGTTLTLEFTVDTTGKPVGFSVTSNADRDLESTVVGAVKQWRFKPAQVNGVPVAMKVVLPVQIVDPAQLDTRLAMN